MVEIWCCFGFLALSEESSEELEVSLLLLLVESEEYSLFRSSDGVFFLLKLDTTGGFLL